MALILLEGQKRLEVDKTSYWLLVMALGQVYLWQSDVSPTAIPDTEDINEFVTSISQSFFQSGPLFIIPVHVVIPIEGADLARCPSIHRAVKCTSYQTCIIISLYIISQFFFVFGFISVYEIFACNHASIEVPPIIKKASSCLSIWTVVLIKTKTMCIHNGNLMRKKC